jgi:pyridinium-3,5-biscarboxylic acid mononucleotide synthase
MPTPEILRTLLERFAAGEVSLDDALSQLGAGAAGYVPVGDFARIDLAREQRTGVPEFIYAPGKTPGQVVAIARRMAEAGASNILVTKVGDSIAEALRNAFTEMTLHDLSRVAVINPRERTDLTGEIGIVTGGTSDLPVAEEAELVCRALGSGTTRIADIGIACISRVLDAVPELARMHVIICAAGMEAALPSVLAGLVPVPVIAVPTSVGYGINSGGYNALLSILGGCVPGVLAVNIDNGIGAAVAAHRINQLAVRGAG